MPQLRAANTGVPLRIFGSVWITSARAIMANSPDKRLFCNLPA